MDALPSRQGNFLESSGFYLLGLRVFLTYMAPPMIPRNNPAVEAVYEAMFRKNVDSNTFDTISSGNTAPASTSTNPIKIRRTGCSLIGTTSTAPGAPSPAHTPAGPADRTSPGSPVHISGGTGSPLADSPGSAALRAALPCTRPHSSHPGPTWLPSTPPCTGAAGSSGSSRSAPSPPASQHTSP
jgi:hypothetical protein